MESLYRKYRPQTFSDVVGQTHIVATLEHAILEKKIGHAYLFCGPRGTGKTTLARIFSKALLCEQGEGHLPDGTCEQCLQIAKGDHPDVLEMDAASRTGVDNIREDIISKVGFAPTLGSHKVYIIDEVHMLTKEAFNSLLKTLEEPPEHVVFIMCTTDPQMILPTILSRVQRFDFTSISVDDIMRRLAYVADKEGFSIEESALDVVARHARGGMRDALSTLEQLSVFAGLDGQTITYSDACSLLGISGNMKLAGVLSALAKRDVATLFETVAEVQDAGQDFLQFTRDLTSAIRDMYVVSCANNPLTLSAFVAGNVETVAAQAQEFGGSDRLVTCMNVLAEAADTMRKVPNQRIVLEVALTRLAKEDTLPKTSEQSADAVQVLNAKVAELERQLVSLQKQLKNLSQNSEGTPGIKRGSIISKPRPSVQEIVDAVSVEQKPAVSEAEAKQLWQDIAKALSHKRGDVAQLIEGSVAIRDDGQTLTIVLPHGAHFACMMLARKDLQQIIVPEVRQVFGHRTLNFVEAEVNEVLEEALPKAAVVSTPLSETVSAISPAFEPALEAEVAPGPESQRADAIPSVAPSLRTKVTAPTSLHQVTVASTTVSGQVKIPAQSAKKDEVKAELFTADKVELPPELSQDDLAMYTTVAMAFGQNINAHKEVTTSVLDTPPFEVD